MDAIKISNLTKRYGWFLSRQKVLAVDDLSMAVPDKIIYGFLGPNGAGKTTTIKMLLGLVVPDAGSSMIYGVDSSQKDIRGRIGFLPESPYFYNHLTAKDFLSYCGKLMQMGRMDRLRRADELLSMVGLEKAANQKLEGFSRGMLQRVGIAQALISDPDLVILDEPITGLDPIGRREVKTILLNLKERGKTVFFSSHVLSDVEEMCDEMGILNHGRLIVSGQVHEVLKETAITVWAEGLSGGADQEQAESISTSVSKKNGRVGFTVDSQERKEALLGLIEKSGGKVREVLSERENLEVFFLSRIKEDDERLAEAAKGGRK